MDYGVKHCKTTNAFEVCQFGILYDRKKRCGLRIEPIQIAVFMHTFGISDFRLGYVEGKKNDIRSSIGMTNKRNETPFLLPKKPQ